MEGFDLDSEYADLFLSQLGLCSIAWSSVEKTTDGALDAALFAHGLSEQGCSTLIQNIDLREKCKIIPALFHSFGIDDAQFNIVNSACNNVSNGLRASRNRLFHDIWSFDDVGFTRITKGTKISRPQSRKIEIIEGEERHTNHKELAYFIHDCTKT